jgi:hypothetical protein
MVKTIGLSVVAGVSMLTLPVQAHHSFPATYLVDQKITIQGTVVQFLFRNPHSFIHVMAPDKDGVMQRWAIEWAAGNALERDHITSETLKPGDKVTVTGSPGRDATVHRMRAGEIIRPSDNWKWSGTFG